MMAYSSLLSVISTRRVRGTGCRARRPCLMLPAWLPLSMMRAICYCSRCAQFLTVFVFPPADINEREGLPVAMSDASVRLDRARSRRKRGFIPHLALRP
jgi:hypothetical protein